MSIRKLGTGAAALLASIATVALAATPALATGDASTAPGETCPNEGLVGFREALSECRGFEMVTPPFEEGEEPTVEGVSEDGSHVLSGSLGNYAGRENSVGTHGTPYLVSRGGGGWGSVALSPSSTVFPAQQYWMASSDLSRSLWRFRSVSEPITGEDLYLREANGSLVKIGSLVPPRDEQGPAAGDDVHFYGVANLEYKDASDDLSDVLFSISKKGALWPFDTTIPKASNHSSLYEYSEGAPEPALVGVSDGGTVLKGVRAKPLGEYEEVEDFTEVLPAGRLISDCRTSLGSEEEDGYNAMSRDGRTVYFTAAGFENPEGSDECENEIYADGPTDPTHPHAPLVNELYARVGHSETVPISEPTFEACEECKTGTKAPGSGRTSPHEAVPEHSAEFAGASEDGSKAFFLTTQELWPGASGKNLYEYDFDAPPGERVIPISSVGGTGDGEVQGVARVSEDGSHVYFVAKGKLAENANQYGRTAVSGQENLYVFSRNAAHPTGEIAFVTPLSGGDSEDWGKKDNYRPFQATPDGQFVVFVSRVNAASSGAVVEGLPQVYEYSAESGELVRVSTGQRGFAEGLENADLGGISAGIPRQDYTTSGAALGPTMAATNLAISADGSTVAFTNQGALTKIALEATGGVAELPTEGERETNAYVFRSSGGVLSSGEVYLVSARIKSLVGLDASGEDVFFHTGIQLVPSDSDGALDLYDARIGGGVPADVPEVPCEGEACHGAPGFAPVLPGVGGSAVASGGNPAPAVSPVSVVSTPAKAGPKALTEAQKLSRALGACRRKSKKLRSTCEKRARRTYRRDK
jgi:hypothetical protein